MRIIPEVRKEPPSSRIVRGVSSRCGIKRCGTEAGGTASRQPEGRFVQRSQAVMTGVRETDTKEVEENTDFLPTDNISSEKQEINDSKLALPHTDHRAGTVSPIIVS